VQVVRIAPDLELNCGSEAAKRQHINGTQSHQNRSPDERLPILKLEPFHKKVQKAYVPVFANRSRNGVQMA
jgi:hypothetical protein